ncbi:MAG: toxin-antitoxin system HicB family antitoxin [Thermosynechococcaceae cyanobacterium]
MPETLHHQLAHLAEGEGVSLNQYITYALTRQVSLAYSIQPVAEDAAQQQKEFAASLQALKQGSSDEVKSILAERESVEPEDDLSAAVIDRFQQRINEYS